MFIMGYESGLVSENSGLRAAIIIARLLSDLIN